GDCRRVFFSEPGSGPRERAAQRRNVSSPFAQPDLLPRLSLVTRLASDCRPCALFPFSVPDVARRRESHASYGSVVQSHVGLSDDDCYARTFHHLPAVCHGVEPHAFSHAADALRRSRDLADERRIREAAKPEESARGSSAHLARRPRIAKKLFVKENSYQILQTFAGGRTIGSPSLQWNASANGAMFEGAAIARNLSSGCGLVFTSSNSSCGLSLAAQVRAHARKNRCLGVKPWIFSLDFPSSVIKNALYAMVSPPKSAMLSPSTSLPFSCTPGCTS